MAPPLSKSHTHHKISYPFRSLSAMDSVARQPDAHPLLFCPSIRFRNEEEEYRFAQFGASSILLPVSSDESHSRPLDLCSYIEGEYGKCRVCEENPLPDTTYYSCNRCLKITKLSRTGAMGYHKKCIEPISKHPYHPKHSLRLLCNRRPTCLPKVCQCCSKFSDWVYYCSVCDFIICPNCARDAPVLAIDHPKRHEHTLYYFLKKESLTCDVCALSDHKSFMYLCLQCDFVVHKKCVYFPWVIRISRHEHRLSFNSSITPDKGLCGVCRKSIDTNYGRYTCVKGCSYGVHSKCATRRIDVWDGEELEGTPEDAYEDVNSFTEIGDGVIEHFSHPHHHMKLEKDTNGEFGENKRCQGCILPICDDIIYSCMQCDDFILHQACAHTPRKKQHALHRHPIRLQVDSREWCSGCRRPSNGFMYKCQEMRCRFRLDVCCASVSEPFDYQYHPHSLYMTSDSEYGQPCSICQRSEASEALSCGECDFTLCFICATLPSKLRYKHDDHFLILSYDKDASGRYWCDICEEEAYLNTNGIYMCNDCNVTLHIQCLLGEEEIYMMPGGKTASGYRRVNILPNNHLTRNICARCHNRCQKQIVFEKYDNESYEKEIFCSYYCRRPFEKIITNIVVLSVL